MTKISYKNGLENMMRMLVQATHGVMKKTGGKRGMEKIGGKIGMETSGGMRGMKNIRGKHGVSLPGIQVVDRALPMFTRHGIRHCFNGKSDGDER